MMNTQLTLVSVIERAEKYFSKKEIVSRTTSGIKRLTYKEFGQRARRLASVLEKLGIRKGERVGTFAWNHHRHLEAYFAVPNIGATLHMVNIRLSNEHLIYIINHAEDKLLIIDEDLVPIIEQIQDELKTVEGYVIMSENENIPQTTLSPVYSYESLLGEGNPNHQFRTDINENDAAGMCYTSATTGNPKGVVYSHRGIVLQCLGLGLADTFALSESDVNLVVVPMFHANAWGMPYASVWFGTTLVFPGPAYTPKILLELIQSEKVTMSSAVPTIWIGVVQELEKANYDLSSMRVIETGGSGIPRGLIKKFEIDYNIRFIQGYGMTEASPSVAVASLNSSQRNLSDDEIINIRQKQGIPYPPLEVKVVNEHGEVAWNDEEMGEILIRGPWIADEYYKDERTKEAFRDGWFHSGDVGTIDEEGRIRLVDRTKDLIKSGGEWISSVDLENALMSHEAVYEATVVSVPHEKWQERPVACVVLKEDYKSVDKEDLLDFLQTQFPKWWLPDDIIFMDEIPKTSVGKFLKRSLREQLKDHLHLAEK
jgi:fatty-acyl-CoA synthase